MKPSRTGHFKTVEKWEGMPPNLPQANIKAKNTTPSTPKTILATTTCASLLMLLTTSTGAVPLLVKLMPDPPKVLTTELVGAPTNLI
jgi:hypothetical protein